MKWKRSKRSKVGTSPDSSRQLSQTHPFLPEATARASTEAPNPDSSTMKQLVHYYQLPVGLNQISNALKIDDPFTKIRIGQINNFMLKADPADGLTYWIGFTWAEIFFPVSGERPTSVIGSRAYEVVLRLPLAHGGAIVRENVVTTGRVVGVVINDLPHETVAVKLEDWFVQSDVFKMGRWGQREVAIRDDARAGEVQHVLLD